MIKNLRVILKTIIDGLQTCVPVPIGILLTYIGIENDSNEAKKALYGCITQQVLTWGCYFGLVYFGEFSFYTG